MTMSEELVVESNVSPAVVVPKMQRDAAGGTWGINLHALQR